jgi:uncharacterized protein YukE
MSDAMWVATGELRAAAPSFAAMATVLELGLDGLGDRLDAEGACWGRDETGETFARSYEPTARAVRAALAGVGRSIGEVGRAVRAVADAVDGADDRATERLS